VCVCVCVRVRACGLAFPPRDGTTRWVYSSRVRSFVSALVFSLVFQLDLLSCTSTMNELVVNTSLPPTLAVSANPPCLVDPARCALWVPNSVVDPTRAPLTADQMWLGQMIT
jgi:hypothetical protein